MSDRTDKKAKMFYSIIAVAFGILCSGLTACSPAAGCNVNRIENSERAAVHDEKNNNAQTDESISPLTEKDVRNLIQFWENAQDAGDFEGYKSCYAKPFKGVKTVSKSSREYDYAEWMDDRRRMLNKAVGLDVEVKNLRISIDDETATVEFDQYYRSKNYSDWGPKVLKVKQTPNGAKIAYELLKESNPL